jgi:hypothetical protein
VVNVGGDSPSTARWQDRTNDGKPRALWLGVLKITRLTILGGGPLDGGRGSKPTKITMTNGVSLSAVRLANVRHA